MTEAQRGRASASIFVTASKVLVNAAIDRLELIEDYGEEEAQMSMILGMALSKLEAIDTEHDIEYNK